MPAGATEHDSVARGLWAQSRSFLTRNQALAVGKPEAGGGLCTSRLAAIFEGSRFLGQTLSSHLSQPVGVLPQSGLELGKDGLVVVSIRTGDLRAQIAYAVVDATG